MAGRKGTGAAGPLLREEYRREQYLALIRENKGRADAAEIMGIVYSTVWRYCKANPEFLEQIIDAEAHVVDSAVSTLAKLMESADKDSDRIAAARAVIAARQRDQGRDHQVVEHRHTIELKGELTAEVVELQRELDKRRSLPPGTVEGVVIED